MRRGRLVVLGLAFVAWLGMLAGDALAQDGAGDHPQDPAEEATDPCAQVRLWEKPKCELREGVSAGVGSIVTAGVTNVFQQLYEWVAAGATWLLARLLPLIDSSTRPQVTADWFGRQYRLMSSLAGALVMPLLMVATLVAVVRQDWRGILRSYFVYLPAAMLGTAIAIPLVDMAVGITDWMSGLFLEPLRGDIETFTAGVTSALSETAVPASAGAGTGVAPFLLFLGAAVIALGAFAVWVELVLRAAGIYVALFFLPLGFAALVWPTTRKWFSRLVKALAALVLSKFVIVAVIALAAVALGNLGADDGTGFGGVIAGLALMLMAAFSPLVLFRLADVAGDEIAGAIEGVTQHRTSPVPTPSPHQMYGRIMNDRAARDRAGKATAGAGATSSTGAATGGAAVAAGAVAGAVKAPGAAGQAAGERVDGVARTNGSAPAKMASTTDGHSPHGEQATAPAASRGTGPGPDSAPLASPPPERGPTARPAGSAPRPPTPTDAGSVPPRPASPPPPPRPPTDPT